MATPSVHDLEELMAFRADTVLNFNDGKLLSNSTVLALASSVLRGALLETSNGNTQTTATATNSTSFTIPIQGCTKQEWLEVAPFWYPGATPAPIDGTDLEKLELLLKVGTYFDLKQVLHAAEAHLTTHIRYMLDRAYMITQELAWEWVRIADTYSFKSSMPLAAQAVALADPDSLKSPEALQQLSAETAKHFLPVLVNRINEVEGFFHHCDTMPCCNCVGTLHDPHCNSLCWVCTQCNEVVIKADIYNKKRRL